MNEVDQMMKEILEKTSPETSGFLKEYIREFDKMVKKLKETTIKGEETTVELRDRIEECQKLRLTGNEIEAIKAENKAYKNREKAIEKKEIEIEIDKNLMVSERKEMELKLKCEKEKTKYSLKALEAIYGGAKKAPKKDDSH